MKFAEFKLFDPNYVICPRSKKSTDFAYPCGAEHETLRPGSSV